MVIKYMKLATLMRGVPLSRGATSSSARAVFKATTTTNTPPTLVTTDVNVAKMLTITVQHIQDANNRTVFSQLLINSGQ